MLIVNNVGADTITIDNLIDGADQIQQGEFLFAETQISGLFAKIVAWQPVFPGDTEGSMILLTPEEADIPTNVECNTEVLEKGYQLSEFEVKHGLDMWDNLSVVTYMGGAENRSMRNLWWNEQNTFTHMETTAGGNLIVGDIQLADGEGYTFGVSRDAEPMPEQSDMFEIPSLTYQFNQGQRSFNYSGVDEMSTVVRNATQSGDNHIALFYLWASRMLAAQHYSERVMPAQADINTDYKSMFLGSANGKYRMEEIAKATVDGQFVMVLPTTLTDDECRALLLATYSSKWYSKNSTSLWCMHAPAGYNTGMFKWSTISKKQDASIPDKYNDLSISLALIKGAIVKYLNYHNLHYQFGRALHIVALGTIAKGNINLPKPRSGSVCIFGTQPVDKQLDLGKRHMGTELITIGIVQESIAASFVDRYTHELEKRGVRAVDQIMNLASALMTKFTTSSMTNYYGGILQYLYGINIYETELLTLGMLPDTIRSFFSNVATSDGPLSLTALLATGYVPESKLFKIATSAAERKRLYASNIVSAVDMMIISTLEHEETDMKKIVPLLRYNCYRADPDNGLAPKRYKIGAHVGSRMLDEIKGNIMIKKTVINFYPNGTTEEGLVPGLDSMLLQPDQSVVPRVPSISIPGYINESSANDILTNGENAIKAGQTANPYQYSTQNGGTKAEVEFESRVITTPDFQLVDLNPAPLLLKKIKNTKNIEKIENTKIVDLSPAPLIIKKTTKTENTSVAFFNEKTEFLKNVTDNAPAGPEEWHAARRTITALLPDVAPIMRATDQYGYNQSIPVGKAIHEAAREKFPADIEIETNAMYLQGLSGRPLSNSDITSQLTSRTGNVDESHIFKMSDEQIEQLVGDTLTSEVISWGKVSSETFEEFYARRIEWMRAGAAFTTLEVDYEPGAPKNKKSLMQQISFTQILEVLGSPPIHRAKAHLKGKENGKVRAILGSAYEHYVIGSFISSKLEEGIVFKNSPMNKRPRELVKESLARVASCNSRRWIACLDYTDFNAQHTSHEQATVIRELFKNSPYQADKEMATIVDWYARSFYNQWIHHGDVVYKANKGLFSGVRVTSLINTVLNLAYHREYCKRLRKESLANSVIGNYNFGDDGWVEFNRESTAIAYCRIAAQSGSQINPGKQMIKHGAGEFLRVMYSRDSAKGCPVRSIENMVFGNTERSDRPYREEKLDILYGQLSVIVRRGADPEACEKLLISEGNYLLGKEDVNATDDQVKAYLYGTGKRLPLWAEVMKEGELQIVPMLPLELKVVEPYKVKHTKAIDDYIDYLDIVDGVKFKESKRLDYIEKVANPQAEKQQTHEIKFNMTPISKYVTYDFSQTPISMKTRVLSKVRKWNDLRPFITNESYHQKMKEIRDELQITDSEMKTLSSEVEEIKLAGDWHVLSLTQCSDPYLATEIASMWNEYNATSDGAPRNTYPSSRRNDGASKMARILRY